MLYKKLKKNLIDLKPKGKFEIDLNFLIIINYTKYYNNEHWIFKNWSGIMTKSQWKKYTWYCQFCPKNFWGSLFPSNKIFKKGLEFDNLVVSGGSDECS